jgi:hypothetical protein
MVGFGLFVGQVSAFAEDVGWKCGFSVFDQRVFEFDFV